MERIIYYVWDCLCQKVISEYKSKYWAYQKCKREIKERNLLANSIVVFIKDRQGQFVSCNEVK